jgi:hypothetical protein
MEAAAADRTNLAKKKKDGPLLTAHLAPVVNSCAMKRCIIRCSIVEDFWFYRAVFGPTLIFVIGISAPLRGLIM